MKITYAFCKSKKREIVLVTGASSGLGFEIAKRLIATNRYKVVVTSRRKSFEKLRTAFQETEDVLLRELDLTEDSGFPKLINDICQLWGSIDILINNAGICYRAVVEHMDVDSEMIQLKTNYLGPMALIRAVLPIMREQKYGRIVNVSSVSGMVSMPTMASYSASKHALEGASEALWYEAKPYGISVTLVEPGFIHSESFKNVVLSKKAKLSYRLNGPHSEYYESMSPFIEKLMRWSTASPHSIARQIEGVLRMPSPPLRARVTLDAKIFAILRKVLPANFFHRLMFYLLPGTKIWGVSVIDRRKQKRDPQLRGGPAHP